MIDLKQFSEEYYTKFKDEPFVLELNRRVRRDMYRRLEIYIRYLHASNLINIYTPEKICNLILDKIENYADR